MIRHKLVLEISKMAKVFVTTLPGNKLAVIRLGPNPPRLGLSVSEWEDIALLKTMFELTRPNTPSGMNEHFNPNNPAHRRGPPVREMDDSLLPANRTQRDRWEEFAGGVRVRPL